MSIDPRDLALCVEQDAFEEMRGAVTVPIVQSALFAQPDFDSLIRGLDAEHEISVYTRGQNPTVEALEQKLAALERGEKCKFFGSGMAAISAVFLGLLEAGDRILFVNRIYGPTLELARHLRRFGIEHDVVLATDPDSVRAALRPETRLLWTENPATMTFETFDLRPVADVAREAGVLVGVDNSWATPLYYKPLTLGADLVMHAASKYLAGHSDVLAGAIVASEELMTQIFYRAYMLGGGILSPHDAWLILRGLRTLPVRMERHQDNARTIAQFLAWHPSIRTVYHPAQETPPADFRGSSGLFSFEAADDSFTTVRDILDGLQTFHLGVSWGGPESLAISPRRPDNGDELHAAGVPPGLIRLSVGLGDPDALIADLDQALSRAFP